MTKQDKLLQNLKAGKSFTAKQISASFGIAHPASAIRNLRGQGYCVYSNSTKLSTGKVATKYRIGNPSKRMIAIANWVGGSVLFA